MRSLCQLTSRGAASRAATIFGVLLASALYCGVALAAPTGFAYVGELRAENGVLYTGAVNVTATVFGAGSGGSALWGPQNLGSVMVSQGLFSIVIGGSGSSGLDTVLMNNDDLWLELTIDSVALSPRQRLRSVPFARVAGSAQMVGNIPAAQVATLGDLAAKPTAAQVGANAPANPVPGQLWLDSQDQKVYVWSMGQWLPVSAAGLNPNDLPNDGLNQVSNGTLSNEFFDVQAAWGQSPAVIPDNNASGINAIVNVNEGAQAKLYGLELQARIEVSVVSQLKILLQPPVSLNVAPILLFEGTVSPAGGTPTKIDWTWTPANTPALAELLNKGPAGQWLLNVADTQFTVAGGIVIAKLEKFDILYDVLRSDEVLMSGDLHVQGDLTVGGALSGEQLQVNGNLNVAGDIDSSGVVRGKHIMWSGGCTNSGTGGGWNTYCTNGVDFSTIDGYLTVNPNGTFTVLVPGFYNVNYFGITGNAAGWFYTQLVVNGNYRHHGHNRSYGNHNDQFMNLTWKFNAGDTFYMSVHNGGGYAFSSWNPQGAHSRLQVTYLGH